jgi:Asp-tRNA(Asn)/Glu-tRNA(Gln) amidotransferase A subunit family amidase
MMAELSGKGPGGLNLLTATEASARLAAGDISSEALVADCLARIAARDAEIGAWAHLDPEHALEQARARDRAAERLGPLHGVPVGVKDVLDTHDMPTEYGSTIHRGHRPEADSACVAALRMAGAVILGKTTTTEFASPVPVGVKNPHDFGRSPGVSSSGSAAAVADYMVPLALGTQTGGSVILPAAFCGVFGFKSSLTGLDRHGIRHLRPTLDTLGIFSRAMDDLALLRAAMMRRAAAPERGAAGGSAGEILRIGVCRTSNWDQAAPEAVEALERAARTLADAGAEVNDVELPAVFDGIEESFRIIATTEGGQAIEDELASDFDRLNWWIRDGAAACDGWEEGEYEDALAHAAACRTSLRALFASRDVLLTPSTAGEATDDLAGISNSAFNRIWTLMHGPCVTIPAYAGPNGLPVGVQIVGPPATGDSVMTAGAWITRRIM